MIEFAGLGLKFEINRVAFSVFGMNIYWYGIIIAFGFALAVILGMKDSKKFGIEPENIIDLVLFAVPVSIIMARIYYVIFSWDQFKGSIWSIFNTRLGGLAIYGALIGALLTAIFFAKYKKISLIKLLDFSIPYMVLAQGIGRWGNFVNQEAYGTHTTLPWGMNGDQITNGPVHPTFLYESLWDICLFFFLVWFRKRKKNDGEVFFLYMILYGAGRFWIESLRTDSLMLGSFRISQVLALIFVIVFTTLFIIRRKKITVSEISTISSDISEYSALLKQINEEKVEEAEKKSSNDKESDETPKTEGG